MKVTVYGIPTCGTCKKALKWLDGKGVSYQWVNTREKAPSKSRIQRWAKALEARKLRNTSGGAYRALGDEKQEWSDKQWVEAFAGDAMLIKRPVLEIDGEPKAVGFKEATWNALL